MRKNIFFDFLLVAVVLSCVSVASVSAAELITVPYAVFNSAGNESYALSRAYRSWTITISPSIVINESTDPSVLHTVIERADADYPEIDFRLTYVSAVYHYAVLIDDGSGQLEMASGTWDFADDNETFLLSCTTAGVFNVWKQEGVTNEVSEIITDYGLQNCTIEEIVAFGGTDMATSGYVSYSVSSTVASLSSASNIGTTVMASLVCILPTVVIMKFVGKMFKGFKI